MASTTVSTATVVTAAMQWRDVRGRIDFLDLDRPQRDRGQAFTLAMTGGHSVKGQNRSANVASRALRATTRHLRGGVENRLRFNRGHT